VSRTTERDSLIEVRANALAATFLAGCVSAEISSATIFVVPDNVREEIIREQQRAALDEAVADGTFRIASGSPSIA
jgi:hypothetical protein